MKKKRTYHLVQPGVALPVQLNAGLAGLVSQQSRERLAEQEIAIRFLATAAAAAAASPFASLASSTTAAAPTPTPSQSEVFKPLGSGIVDISVVSHDHHVTPRAAAAAAAAPLTAG